MDCRRLLLCALVVACWLAAGATSSGAVEVPELKVSWQTLPDHACFGTCPQWVALEGKIVPDSVAKVRDALARQPAARLVLVHSAGGHVESAMAIARLIRARGVPIVVARTIEEDCFRSPISCVSGEPARAMPVRGYCASACVQLLAGGAERAVLGEGYVGVHRYMIVARTTIRRTYRVTLQTDPDGRQRKVRQLESETSTTEPVNKEQLDPAAYATARSFFRSLGVSAELVDALENTAHADMRRLEPAEMSRWTLTTASPASLFAASVGQPDEDRIVFSSRARRVLQTVVLRRKPAERIWRAEAWVTEAGAMRPARRQFTVELPGPQGKDWSAELTLANGEYQGPPWSGRLQPDRVCAILAARSLIVSMREDTGAGPPAAQKASIDQTDVAATASAVRSCGRSRTGPV